MNTLTTRFTSFLSLLLFSLLVSGCSIEWITDQVLTTQQEPQSIDSESFKFYTYPRQEFQFDQLDQALAASDPADTVENLIIFVHGMGDYPDKSFEEDMSMKRLEENYDAQVIMFNWPSWISWSVIPRTNADTSGAYFAHFLNRFDSLLQANTINLRNLNRTVLFHSLGSQVLKSYLSHYRTEVSDTLFHNVLMAAPEVALSGHAAWLKHMNFASDTYITSNSDDLVLKQVEYISNQARLGIQIDHLDGSPEPLAQNATYLIADSVAGYHRYYISDDNPVMVDVFKRIISNDFQPVERLNYVTRNPAIPNVLTLRDIKVIPYPHDESDQEKSEVKSVKKDDE